MVAKASTPRARTLRRQSTDAEKMLWSHIRNRALAGAKFKRQVAIARFFADFACIEKKLIIELDGGQHDANKPQDDQRTKALEAAGYRVLGFWNNDVLGNIEGVVDKIARELETPSP